MIAFPSNKSCPRCKGEMQYICLTSYPPQYKARCLYCGYEEGNTIQKQTNADRIRAMTDEELAEFINDVFYTLATRPGMCDVCDNDSVTNCRECWLQWLKQEAT